MPACPSATPHRLAPVLGLLLAATVACGRSDRQAVLEPRLRFVEEAPEEIFSRESLLSEEQLFAWRPEPEDRCLAIWPHPPGAQTEIALGGQRGTLKGDQDRVQVLLNAGGETGSVERLDLVLESRDPAVTRTGEVQLCWAGAAEPWSAERCAHLAHGELAAGGSRHYRFALGTHPAWRREASKLAVTVVPPVVDEVALCAVNGFAEELRPERLAELAAGGFQTVLDGQIRYALPAVPDLPIERDLEVPRDAELRFAYAVPAGLRAAITFRVSARAGAKPASELFRAPVAEEEDRGRWHEARVDLGPWAGERITLRLETSAEAGLEVQHGLPLWGNPEVLAP